MLRLRASIRAIRRSNFGSSLCVVGGQSRHVSSTRPSPIISRKLRCRPLLRQPGWGRPLLLKCPPKGVGPRRHLIRRGSPLRRNPSRSRRPSSSQASQTTCGPGSAQRTVRGRVAIRGLVDNDLAGGVVRERDLAQLALQFAQLFNRGAQRDDGVAIVSLALAGLVGLEKPIPQRPPPLRLRVGKHVFVCTAALVPRTPNG